MAKDTTSPNRVHNRWIVVFSGMLMGAAWGTLMVGAFRLFGQDFHGHGVKAWLYIAITMAMIGGGVAAFFGTFAAKSRGERITPRRKSNR